MNNKVIGGMKYISYLFGLLVISSAAQADDYKLDPAPKEIITWNEEVYEAPQDKEVCSLFLENLRYFARRNEPMSCGQPIAPMLNKKIRTVEWENLDPDQNSDLFKAIVKDVHFIKDEPSQKELDWRRQEIREGVVVFRRIKFALRGYPRFEGEAPQAIEKVFNIVQYGYDVTNPHNPQTTWRCPSVRGRTMVYNHNPSLFVVTKELDRIYSGLWDMRGESGQNLWLINDRIYGELYNENGDVKLTELRSKDIAIHLEPVCLYHFKRTTHAKE